MTLMRLVFGVPLQTLFWLAVFLIKVTPLVEALCGKDFL